MNPFVALSDVLREIIELLNKGERQRAAKLYLERIAHVIMGFLRRHHVSDAEAKELVINVFLKMLHNPCPRDVNPAVWLWSLVNSVLMDWKRSAYWNSKKEESSPQITDIDPDTLPSSESPHWLKLCVERAAHELQVQDPNRAHVLYLSFHGHSAAEIAVIFGAKPPPSKEQETAARNRVLVAMKKARDFFAHCKEY